MKSQTEQFSVFQKFFAEIRNQFHTSICILRGDNVLEYLFAFLSSHGILHRSSYDYTPQQNNGVAERKNRHLVETTRTLLLHHTVPQRFLRGCYLNRHILTPGQDKLSVKATKCIFLGYSCLQRGYRCYSPNTHRYFVSVEVTFFEHSSSLPHRLPVLRSYLYLSSFPLWPYHLSPQLLHLDHYRFILVIHMPTPSLSMAHLLWRPPP